MNDKETAQLLKKLIKKIEKDYGNSPCPDFDPACANCQAYIFLGYLRDVKWWFEYERPA